MKILLLTKALDQPTGPKVTSDRKKVHLTVLGHADIAADYRINLGTSQRTLQKQRDLYTILDKVR